MDRYIRLFLLLCLITNIWAPAYAGMATPGVLAVNQVGTATYSIPIQSPPGLGGFRPQLSLEYSSQSGNGLLGVGWSIGGLSSISGCPQTQAQDNLARPVKNAGYGATGDRFCLDGSRLVTLAGAQGANPSYYVSELERFNRALYRTNSITGRLNFELEYSPGYYATYGGTNDSVLLGPGNSEAVWAISTLQQDSHQTFYKYFQDEKGGMYVTHVIYDAYGNVSTSDPNYLNIQNSVRFIYEARPDVVLRYQGRILFKSDVRLSKVLTYRGATKVKEYRLVYEQESITGRSRLLSVSECDATVNCLPSTSFSYATSSMQFGAIVQSAVVDAGAVAGRSWADFDGDGKADFCRVVGNAGANRLACTLSSVAGFGDTVISNVIDAGSDDSRAWVDVNGDGRTDYCRLTGTANKIDSRVVCTLSAGNGFGETVTSAVLDWGWPTTRAWVDVNGDGRIDFCRALKGKNLESDTQNAPDSNAFGLPSCLTYDSTGFTKSVEFDYTSLQDAYWRDVNNDGRADFCGRSPTNGAADLVCVSVATQGLFYPSLGGADIGLGEPGSAVVDANDDGLADYCRVRAGTEGSQLECKLGWGESTWSRQTLTSALLDAGLSNGRMWKDVNGDGMADYCRITGSAGTYKAECTLSSGFGFGASVSSAVLDPGQSSGQGWADVNGDGNLDFCRVTGSTNLVDTRLVCTSLSIPFPGVSKINNGLGHELAISYKPLPDVAVYTRDNNATYPQQDVQSAVYMHSPLHMAVPAYMKLPRYVVSSVSASDSSNTSTNNYRYGGLKRDLAGRESLGFRWIEVTSAGNGLTTRTEYRQDFPFTGMVSLVRKMVASGGNNGLLSQQTYVFDCSVSIIGIKNCTPYFGAHYKIFPTKNELTGWDLNGAVLPTVTTTYEYTTPDPEAAMSGETTTQVSKSVTTTSDGFTTTAVNSYDITDWSISPVFRTTVTKSKP